MKLDASSKGSGDFFVLASPRKNDQVKFVSGDPEIKDLAAAVKSSDLGLKFPDPASVRALRRGTLNCGTVPPPPTSKGKAAGSKNAKGKGATVPPANTEPAAKPELLPGPCTIELIPSDVVRALN
jgi:hypothetical protein